MNQCDYNKEHLSFFLSGELNEKDTQLLKVHLSTCNECKEELAALQMMWNVLPSIAIEEPSETMQADFNAILKNYKKEHQGKNSLYKKIADQLKHLWNIQPRLQLSYSLILVFTGLLAGYFLNRPTGAATKDQINSLASQVADMKQTLMITLLENPSASERIRAVNYSSEINNADAQIIDALLTTLNNDPNVNVRLATLDALAKFSKEPAVREGLIKSISQQESPILQTAIAELMVKLQEKRSVKPLKELLNKKDVDEMVKSKIKESIRLIS